VPEDLNMPQPLSRVVPNADLNIGAGALSRVPQFSSLIMTVIANLAHLDGDWGTIFSRLLKSDIAVGTAVYQAFNGLEARRIALFAAADKALPEWQMIALRAVWSQTTAARAQRDRFAHHVWATSEQVPDALLLMDPSVVVERNISFRQQSVELPDGRGVIAPQNFDHSRVFVYRQGDFERAAKEAQQAAWIVTLLHGAIGNGWIEVARRQLWNEPRFQQAVRPLIREKGPEVQAQFSPPGEDPPAKGISETWDRHLGRIS
jgi:hypothetical protein